MVSASPTFSIYKILFSGVTVDDNSPANLNSDNSHANNSSPANDNLISPASDNPPANDNPPVNNIPPTNDNPPALTPAGGG